MTRTFVVDSVRQTTSPRLEWNRLFAQCRWGWMKVLIGDMAGWNQIQFNLSDFTRRAYGSNYIETLRVTIHANCRIRRIYFSDRLYSEEELPPEFKLFLPVQKQQWPNWFLYCVLLYFPLFCRFPMWENVLFFGVDNFLLLTKNVQMLSQFVIGFRNSVLS